MSQPEKFGRSFDCLIVGAGISGMLAARTLSDAGMRVCVLEKGRGLGGRMANRRRDGATFDHGAQFFTVRDERFGHWVEKWKAMGLVAPWYELGDAGTHYCGLPGMTSIAKHLAEGIDVRREVLVRQVRFQSGAWTLTDISGEDYCSRALLLTAPVPQSLALLDSGQIEFREEDRSKLESIRYHRCIAALAILDGPSALNTHNGALKLSGHPLIQWIGDNQKKGISAAVPSVTIHSTPGFAEEHWDCADDVRLPPLLEAAAPYLDSAVVSCQGHRWGFSQPVESFGREAFVDGERCLAIAGDGMAGGRVEGAALSGLAAAKELASVLGRPA